MQKKRFIVKFLAGLLGLGLVLWAHAPHTAVAAPTAIISVDGTTCTLPDAITAANTNTATGGCNAGSSGGVDQLDLLADVVLYDTNYGSGTGPLVVTSGIFIFGNGFTIESDDTGTNAFRTAIFDVYSTGELTLNNVTITNAENDISLSESGSVINNRGGTVTIAQSTITANGNGDGAGGSNGGAVISNLSSGQLNIASTTFSSNSEYQNGNVIYNEGTADILTSTFTDNNNNTTGGLGAVIRNIGTLELRNSTISGNEGYGVTTGGTADIYNSTITDNSYTGVNTSGFTAGIVTNVYTSLINRNRVGNASGNVNTLGSSVTNLDSHNVIGLSGNARSVPAVGASDVVPSGAIGTVMDATLQDNGGPTDTHMLVTGSPAIDVEDGGVCQSFDQRGNYRDTDCDAGAVEIVPGDAVTQAVTKAVTQGNTYVFGNTAVQAEIVSDGGCLTEITVQRIESNHPQASPATPGLQTGRYWDITATPGGCTGFDINLTLPFLFAPGTDDKACRWTGSAWDCGTAGVNSLVDIDSDGTDDAVVRTGVNAFSDWAVGNNVSPTSVQLSQLQTASPTVSPVLLMLFAVMALTTAVGGVWLLRRPR